MTEDPTRLTDAEGTTTPLGLDLHRVRAQDAGYDAVAGLARFEAAIAAPPPAPGVDAASTAAGTSKAVWIAAAIVGAATAGAVAWAIAASKPDPSAHASGSGLAPVSAATSVAPPPEDAPLEEQLPSPAADATSQSPAPETAVPPASESTPEPTKGASRAKPGRSPSTPKSGSRPKPEGDRFAAEMRATTVARSALKDAPARAIKLVDAAQAKFGEGTLGEERRGIKVLALFAVGKTAAAQREAAAYLKRNPKGTYAARIRAASSE